MAAPRCIRSTGFALALAVIAVAVPLRASAQCIADNTINSFFETEVVGGPIPQPGSCCQSDVCGIPCPAEQDPPTKGFGIAVGVAIGFFCAIGFGCYFLVRGDSSNFFVAGRTLPMFVCSLTLASQSLDSNALLGNADLSYKFQFYDGAALPIGLAMSLFLNAVFLARHINNSHALTLPEIYGQKYGALVEVLVSLISCASFVALLAGNLVGMSTILGYIYDLGLIPSVFISGAIMLVYTMCGGLFSVAYSDVVQSITGITGALVTVIWFMTKSPEQAPPPSIGMPKPDNASATAGLMMYPDNIGDGGVCDMYEGVPCEFDPSACCYNQQKWCPTADNCTADNGAYPIGDQPIFYNQMSDPYSLTPFPNAILFNWAVIFALSFGNLAALDFQARNLAAKTPKVATISNIIAGCLTLLIGVPFSYMGAITRYFYGPDSQYAQFETDTCSAILDLPQCGMWLPDPNAVIKLLTHEAPAFIGGWCLVAIVAASMSTSDGAILALGTVGAHNLARRLPVKFSEKHLLQVARFAAVPFTLIACLVAAFFKSGNAAGATGYLLVVAFDIMLAGTVVPLFAMFYMKEPSPNAALAAVVGGSLMRIILEFTLPKDGFLLAPYPGPEFLNYGPVSSDLYPGWFDVPAADKWDPATCKQERFEDWTGLDSLLSPVFSLLCFFTVWSIERFTSCKNVFSCLPSSWMTPVPPHVEVHPGDSEKYIDDEKLGKEGLDSSVHSGMVGTGTAA
mmetsp:Transcript_29388/g.75967  ORF Transcript_29388/g.75967 Transcript_29388/m.75967 type:complete len:738 (+) Transcript_29388:123-2336(+)|eukprot:jgi/Tetstr1/422250/TSEL_013102.t1